MTRISNALFYQLDYHTLACSANDEIQLTFMLGLVKHIQCRPFSDYLGMAAKLHAKGKD